MAAECPICTAKVQAGAEQCHVCAAFLKADHFPQASPVRHEALYETGFDYFQKNELGAAIQCWKRIPSNLFGVESMVTEATKRALEVKKTLDKGDALLAGENFQEYVAGLERVASFAPVSAGVLRKIEVGRLVCEGNKLMRTWRFSRALRLLDNALQLTQKMKPPDAALSAQIQQSAGMARSRQKRFRTGGVLFAVIALALSAVVFGLVIHRRGQEADARKALGKAQALMERGDLSGALEAYRRVVREYSATNCALEARRHAEEVEKYCSGALAVYQEGENLRIQGLLHAAKQKLTRLVQDFPLAPQVGEARDKITLVEKGIADAKAQFDRGLSHVAEGRLDEAVLDLDRAMRSCRDSPFSDDASARLGQISRFKEEVPRALTDIRRLVAEKDYKSAIGKCHALQQEFAMFERSTLSLEIEAILQQAMFLAAHDVGVKLLAEARWTEAVRALTEAKKLLTGYSGDDSSRLVAEVDRQIELAEEKSLDEELYAQTMSRVSSAGENLEEAASAYTAYLRRLPTGSHAALVEQKILEILKKLYARDAPVEISATQHIIELKGGKSKTGKVAEEGDSYVLEESRGTARIKTRYPKSEVISVKLPAETITLQEYNRRVQNIDVSRQDELFRLGEWCLAQGLRELAARQFWFILQFDPENQKAKDNIKKKVEREFGMVLLGKMDAALYTPIRRGLKDIAFTIPASCFVSEDGQLVPGNVRVIWKMPGKMKIVSAKKNYVINEQTGYAIDTLVSWMTTHPMAGFSDHLADCSIAVSWEGEHTRLDGRRESGAKISLWMDGRFLPYRDEWQKADARGLTRYDYAFEKVGSEYLIKSYVKELGQKNPIKRVLHYKQIDGIFILDQTYGDLRIQDIRVNEGIPDSAFDQ